MIVRCAHCKQPTEKATGEVNRAHAAGLRLYCGRRCFGLDRRSSKTKAQRVEEKRLYDAKYRSKNREILKAKKHEYFKRTYDPAKAAVERKKRMPKHVEYCRRPEYRAWKRDYDRQYRAKEFGPFAEAYLMTIDLNREIKGRMSNEQISQANGTFGKAQKRRREDAPQRPEHSRPRHRERRAGHSAANR